MVIFVMKKMFISINEMW